MKSANSMSSSRARTGSVRMNDAIVVQRVVDEVRADLGPQRAHLGPVEAGAGVLQLGELELAGDVARDLGGGTQDHRARPSRW